MRNSRVFNYCEQITKLPLWGEWHSTLVHLQNCANPAVKATNFHVLLFYSLANIAEFQRPFILREICTHSWLQNNFSLFSLPAAEWISCLQKLSESFGPWLRGCEQLPWRIPTPACWQPTSVELWTVITPGETSTDLSRFSVCSLLLYWQCW